MRIFSYQFQNSFTELYQFILGELIEQPDYKTAPRGLPIRECVNAAVIINPTDCHIDFSKTMAPDRQEPYDKYCKAELDWYISGQTKASSAPSKFWEKLADPNGKITSNYGHMMLYDKVYPSKQPEEGVETRPDITGDHPYIILDADSQTPYEKVVETLTKDPDSRQAIVHYNQPKHCYPQNKDFPCTVYSQFFIRDGKLNMTTYQRSCDIIKGFSYDVPWSCFFMRMVMHKLQEVGQKLELGTFTHVFGSLHLYEKDLDLAQRIIKKAGEA